MAVVQGAILSVTVMGELSVSWKELSIVERDAGETEVEVSVWVISEGGWLTDLEDEGAGRVGPRGAEVEGEAERAEEAETAGEAEGTGGAEGI